jgi:hypothetical protein
LCRLEARTPHCGGGHQCNVVRGGYDHIGRGPPQVLRKPGQSDCKVEGTRSISRTEIGQLHFRAGQWRDDIVNVALVCEYNKLYVHAACRKALGKMCSDARAPATVELVEYDGGRPWTLARLTHPRGDH